jgi:hypothetical protein
VKVTQEVKEASKLFESIDDCLEFSLRQQIRNCIQAHINKQTYEKNFQLNQAVVKSSSRSG